MEYGQTPNPQRGNSEYKQEYIRHLFQQSQPLHGPASDNDEEVREFGHNSSRELFKSPPEKTDDLMFNLLSDKRSSIATPAFGAAQSQR